MTDVRVYVGEPSDRKWTIRESETISEMFVNDELYRFDPPISAIPGDELFIVTWKSAACPHVTVGWALEVRHRYEARAVSDEELAGDVPSS